MEGQASNISVMASANPAQDQAISELRAKVSQLQMENESLRSQVSLEKEKAESVSSPLKSPRHSRSYSCGELSTQQ